MLLLCYCFSIIVPSSSSFFKEHLHRHPRAESLQDVSASNALELLLIRHSALIWQGLQRSAASVECTQVRSQALRTAVASFSSTKRICLNHRRTLTSR